MNNAVTVDFLVDARDGGAVLGVYLRRRGVSLSALRSLKNTPGGITVNGVPARARHTLCAGDTVLLMPKAPAGFSAAPCDIPLTFIYQSRDALVVDKPPGMVTHPSPSHRGGSLANAFCGMMSRRFEGAVFYPVGRLDGDTSGMALMAMNPLSAPLLAQTAQKVYLALVQGCLPTGEGAISAPLGAAAGSKVRQCVLPGGRKSVTEYRVIAAGGGASLVLARPLTGRTHQIRAHFAHIGHPLLGDALYGGQSEYIRRHALHCASLTFTEIGGNSPRLWCAPPGDMRCAAAALGLPMPCEA